MKTLRCLLFLTVLVVLGSSQVHAAPPDFLQTNIPAWNQVLKGKINQKFSRVSPGYVARRLGELGGAKVVVNIPAGANLPLISPRYHLVPLREAFYQLSQDTGLQFDWYYVGRLPTAIRVSLPAANAVQGGPHP